MPSQREVTDDVGTNYRGPIKAKARAETEWLTNLDLIGDTEKYDLVEEDGSMLQKFIQHGDNRNARLHTQLVARRLNRLQPASDNSLQLRERTRRAMLWALKDLPVRNESAATRRRLMLIRASRPSPSCEPSIVLPPTPVVPALPPSRVSILGALMTIALSTCPRPLPFVRRGPRQRSHSSRRISRAEAGFRAGVAEDLSPLGRRLCRSSARFILVWDAKDDGQISLPIRREVNLNWTASGVCRECRAGIGRIREVRVSGGGEGGWKRWDWLVFGRCDVLAALGEMLLLLLYCSPLEG
ncbi:hypothetical protein LSH36_153g04086 [Paralvinella palmiformis]|uniref:Uncharacterized protein n=1 Tax=Paralvinella palmiformis TaxID=53620 RepID=A0AAD9N8Z1_9ANNE|nr:hypothetical protein LSH36_153g04086 [Paralvinella palmiformis]